jgi:AcrR family transcriptional regulator
MATQRAEASARDRLLAAANELFYAEGVHTVGIDRVIERAGVAKASLYSTFGSKEELVRAYLQMRADARQRRISERIAQHESPRDKLLAVFDVLRDVASEPTYRGCAFVNARAEGPRGDTKVTRVCADMRGWLRSLFVELARACGAADPDQLGRRLALLHDGASVGASMDGTPDAAAEARAVAEVLLDAQCRAAGRRAPGTASERRDGSREARVRKTSSAGRSAP